MADFKTGDIWQGMLAVLRPQFWTLFAVAAPFTLLVEMAVALFGPAQPKSFAEFTLQAAIVLVLIPGLIGAIAQLAVAHIVARPYASPRLALAAAAAALPAYVAAVAIAAIPTGIGFLLLIVPGLYITARLFLVVPVAVLDRVGAIDVVRRSWNLTENHAWTILLFLLLAILFLLGISVLASGIGAALASVLTIIGLKSVGTFAAALVPAIASTAFSIASATAATIMYLRLAADPSPAG